MHELLIDALEREHEKITLAGNTYTATRVISVNHRPVSCFDKTDIKSAIDDVEVEISKHPSYGKDDKLLNRVLNLYPLNNDEELVAMKIALVDVTNSTHLSQHKAKVSISELASHIVNIQDFDKRVAKGELELVKEIIDFSTDINLFSFASKYCHLHNRHIHNGDAYSKFDGIVSACLPAYFEYYKVNPVNFSLNGKTYKYKKLTYNSLDTIRKNRDYPAFVKIIDILIEKINLSSEPKIRAMLDHFIWYTNR